MELTKHTMNNNDFPFLNIRPDDSSFFHETIESSVIDYNFDEIKEIKSNDIKKNDIFHTKICKDNIKKEPNIICPHKHVLDYPSNFNLDNQIYIDNKVFSVLLSHLIREK